MKQKIERTVEPNVKTDMADIWKALLEKDADIWKEAQASARNDENKKRILVATSMGCYDHGVILETALSVALTLRGAHIDVLLCDRFLPCCQMTKYFSVSPAELLSQEHTPRCAGCDEKGNRFYSTLGLPIYWYSQWVPERLREQAKTISRTVPYSQIGDYRYDGLAVGEHARAGALRYYSRGDMTGEPEHEPILRRFLESALLTAFAVGNLLRMNAYDSVVFHHGIYVPQGVIGEVCRQKGVHVVNWNPSYRNQTFIFSHDDSYHHTMITEPVEEWENIPWTGALETQTLEYLKSRWYGTGDWIWFHESPQDDPITIAQTLGIDFNQPCIGMLSSVMWDAQLHYASNAFKNMLDWVLQTIAYFSQRPDLQLILRVHPAEVRGMIPARQKLADEIRNVLPSLPPNIFIVPPESEISTYALMEKCNAVIIYNTKTGIELSSMGIPVIVAGEAWIRNKGFSRDASSPAEYFAILDQLPFPGRLKDEQVERARKYAYHFFFRRMIDVPFVVNVKKFKFALNLASIRELLPGVNPGVDVICEGILEKTPFIQ
ncbi:MAG: capsule biosynthesis protein [Candidatus Omnitrophota bacterium]